MKTDEKKHVRCLIFNSYSAFLRMVLLSSLDWLIFFFLQIQNTDHLCTIDDCMFQVYVREQSNISFHLQRKRTKDSQT